MKIIITLIILFSFNHSLMAQGSQNNKAYLDETEMIDMALKDLTKSLNNLTFPVKTAAVGKIEPENLLTKENELKDRLNAILLESGKFNLVDRSSLETLLKEQKLSAMGLIDTGSLISAGKLIGVEGFFFGNAVKSKNEVKINLKLVNVQTGAIIYSKEFIGKNLSKPKVSLGWIYSSSSFNDKLNINNLRAPSLAGYEMTAQGYSAAGLNISYLQNLKSNKTFALGADLSIANFLDLDGAQKRIDSANHIAFHEISFIRLGFKPKIYATPNFSFNQKNQLLKFYAGFSFDYFLITLDFDAENFVSGGAPKQAASVETSLFSVSPLLGAETDLTKNISFYAEATLQNAKDLSQGKKVLVSDIEMESFPSLKSKLLFNLGLKYYFNPF